MVAKLSVDHKGGSYVVYFSLVYEKRKRKFRVHVRPNPRVLQFDAFRVCYRNGHLVQGDLQYLVSTEAVRIVFEKLESQLSCNKYEHHRIANRVRISYYLTILLWIRQGRMVSMRKDDLYILARVARGIVWLIVGLKIDSRHTVHDIDPEYFQELKRNELVRIRGELPFSNESRDFFSSVLSRAFGWKGGKVPCESVKLAHQFMPVNKLK